MSNGVGHSSSDIGNNFTARQIRLFYGRAVEREDMNRANRIIDISAGFSGGEEAQSMVGSLRGED